MDKIELILDVIDTGAIIAALVVSIIGFYKWKEELKGKSKFELSKNIVSTAYKIRDRIKTVTSPFLFAHEYKNRGKNSEEAESKEKVLNSFYAYSNRFKELQLVLDEWYGLKIEAEALFDKRHRLVLDKLDSVCNELWGAIHTVHDYRYHNDDLKDSTYRECYNIMYGINPTRKKNRAKDPYWEDGDFQKNLDDTISSIEEKFKIYLK